MVSPSGQAEQLRVALFSGNYNCVRDGANRALNRLVGYLLAHNVDVRIFSPTVDEPAFPPTGELISVPSIPIPFRSEYRFGTGFSTAKRVLDEFKPHLLHLSTPDMIGTKAKRYGKARGLAVVSSYHTRFDTYLRYYGVGFLAGYLRRQNMLFYQDCDQVYVPSQSIADEFRKDSAEVVLRNWTRGVNCDDFTPEHRNPRWREERGLDLETPIILFVGRLVKEKGLDLLVKTVRDIKARGREFQTVVVGAGPEESALREAIPDAYFTGFLDRQPLTEAYANGDIFFNPSTTEAFGNVTLEAMASGLAPVCSRASGSEDLVDHGYNGFLATPNDVKCHAAFTEKLLEDSEQRIRMGTINRQLAQQRSWDRVMEELFGHYQEVLSKRYPETAFTFSADPSHKPDPKTQCAAE